MDPLFCTGGIGHPHRSPPHGKLHRANPRRGTPPMSPAEVARVRSAIRPPLDWQVVLEGIAPTVEFRASAPAPARRHRHLAKRPRAPERNDASPTDDRNEHPGLNHRPAPPD